MNIVIEELNEFSTDWGAYMYCPSIEIIRYIESRYHNSSEEVVCLSLGSHKNCYILDKETVDEVIDMATMLGFTVFRVAASAYLKHFKEEVERIEASN